jgi:hypothetical protein
MTIHLALANSSATTTTTANSTHLATITPPPPPLPLPQKSRATFGCLGSGWRRWGRRAGGSGSPCHHQNADFFNGRFWLCHKKNAPSQNQTTRYVHYLHTSSNLFMYLLTYVHTYVTANEPMYLRTFVPTYLYYLHTTNIPTDLSYLHAYLLTYLHIY